MASISHLPDPMSCRRRRTRHVRAWRAPQMEAQAMAYDHHGYDAEEARWWALKRLRQPRNSLLAGCARRHMNASHAHTLPKCPPRLDNGAGIDHGLKSPLGEHLLNAL